MNYNDGTILSEQESLQPVEINQSLHGLVFQLSTEEDSLYTCLEGQALTNTSIYAISLVDKSETLCKIGNIKGVLAETDVPAWADSKRKEILKEYNQFHGQQTTKSNDYPLYDKSYCRPIPSDRTLNGLVLTLNHEALVEEDSIPQNLLYMCVDSEIDPPDYEEVPVQVISLYDGEQYSWNIEDFVGVLLEEHLPDWACSVKETMPKPMTTQEKLFEKGRIPEFNLSSDCRILAEYNNILLMARKKDRNIDYITYALDYDKNGVNTGKYTDFLEEASLDFAIRSGLVSSSYIFTKEEKLALGDACQYALDYTDMSEESSDNMQNVLNKIDYDCLVADRDEEEEENENER